ncbi:hypothetical protein [Bradyrhizobium erythrophlei]|uniref:Uncharacterized protein n=1 Tax=Bradyrhizobium erythrophlei TaxID=1437360 RepID=A0A1M5YIR9_9BRAD|nr:hypothetical protein [Bradyrhizobium erythrophlei]SHI11895.1 hypothetical protein SAMN05443248_8372 [Bradyrhizobium erythrophlei]
MTAKKRTSESMDNPTGTEAEKPMDPFSPENLRLSQSFADTTAVKKLITTVPVRKPNSQDFVRVHAGAGFCENFPLIQLKDDNEQYLVVAKLAPELASEIVSATLYLATNKQGVIFFWPVRLPDADGKDFDAWRSAREAAELAKETWVRQKWNKSLGAYDIYEAANQTVEPEWPADLDYWDLIKIAFRDHIIQELDHPVVKRLRGLI